jgi:acyl-CoA synthetase (AMP-forming)/AMP-acid ligase II
MLNLSSDRYRFAVGLGAALLRGHPCLLPPNHTPHTVARLRARFAGAMRWSRAEGEGDGCRASSTPGAAPAATAPAMPHVDADRVAAHVLTSGSTGDPVPHAKPWGLLAASARAEAAGSPRRWAALARRPDARRDRAGRSTCTASSRACCSPCTAAPRSTRAGRSIPPTSSPRSPRRRAAGAGDDAVPPEGAARVRPGDAEVALVVCAHRRRSRRSSRRARRRRFAAPLVEIYGCTEAGQVATRRTTAGAEWQTFAGLR